jgi:hypothetical protein
MRGHMMLKEKIEIYKKQAYITSKIDYSNKKTIAENNRAVDKMYKIIKSLEDSEIESFYILLDDLYAKKWIAHQLIETQNNLPKDIIKKCFSIVESLAKENTLESAGEKIWLNEWKTKKYKK